MSQYPELANLQCVWATQDCLYFWQQLQVQFSKATLSFDKLLKRLTEFTETYFIHGYIYCNEGISQRKRCIGQCLGGVQTWSFPLSVESWMALCPPGCNVWKYAQHNIIQGSSPEPLTSGDFIGVWSHTVCMADLYFQGPLGGEASIFSLHFFQTLEFILHDPKSPS